MNVPNSVLMIDVQSCCAESAAMNKKFGITIARLSAVLSIVVLIGSDQRIAYGQHNAAASSRIHHSGQPAVNHSPGISQPSFNSQYQNVNGSFQGGSSAGFRSGLQPSLTPNSTGFAGTSQTYNQFGPGVNAVSPNGGMVHHRGFGQTQQINNGQMGNNFGQGFQGTGQSGVTFQPSVNGTQPFLGNNVNYNGYNNNAGGINYQQTHFRHTGHNHSQWNGYVGNNGNFGFNGNAAPVQGYGIGNFSSQQFNNDYGNGGFGSNGFGGLGYGGLGYAGFGGMAYAGTGYPGMGYGNMGFGGGGFGSLAYGSGYLGYSNPYFNNTGFNTAGQMGNGFNYTQPLLVNYRRPAVSIAPTTTLASKPSASAPAISAQTMLDSSVAAFKLNQFDMALKVVNQAVYEYPNEVALHEFRALVLFAKGDYQPAAATMHSVLAASRGWDWGTMISVYSDVGVYTTQLRALEGAVKQNPDDGANRFLLACHYLTAGFTEPAAKMLRKVVVLVPSDRVAAEMLKAIDGPEQVKLPELATEPTPQPILQPPPADASAVAAPIDPEKFIGTWQASRADGSVFSLDLTKEKTFKWSFTSKDQSPQSFEGTYSVQGDVITLERNGGGSLVAKIRPGNETHFQFKLFGAPEGDPGLDFARS